MKGGYTLSNLGFEPGYGETTSTLSGFHAGLTIGFDIGETYGFETGLIYIKKGENNKLISYDNFLRLSVVNRKISISFISVPMNFKYYSNNIYLKAGPYIAFALSVEVETESLEDSTIENIKFGNKSGEIKTLDLGFSLGIGYQLTKHISSEISTDLGLINMSNINEIRTRSLNLSIVYFFPLSTQTTFASPYR